ncbi:anti-sigma factor [Leifsonia sp. LS1]|uniref:anti-sigma factor family protein n=1 Tax=Leifsonia sp. LS1 TaxID=2828483 RepID=UPI001CFCE98E|nr:zf-HC2 domain-containing protein [Leifsonia sp. LS1]GIT79243.1 anti-sigma factor [Leifsonia sp. LS1]
MTTHDEFATWDASYVLGALSPADRRAFEEHLRTCESCSAAVAELAGVPGLLGLLPREQGMAALAADAPEPGGVGAEVLPLLVKRVRRQRLRTRWLTAGVAAAAAVLLLGVLSVVLPSVIGASAPEAKPIAMEQVEPSALSADLRLTSEPWGTRIDSRCSYADVGGGHGTRSWTYAMVVTDREGRQTQVSTWTAQEGTTVVPTATTSVALADIAAIDIRAAGDGTVLLRSTFG